MQIVSSKSLFNMPGYTIRINSVGLQKIIIAVLKWMCNKIMQYNHHNVAPAFGWNFLARAQNLNKFWLLLIWLFTL